MRTHLFAAVATMAIGVFSTVSAQAPNAANAPAPTAETADSRLRQLATDPAVRAQLELLQALMARHEAERARGQAACEGPGNTPVALNEEIFFDGRSYRCVDTYGPNAAPGMANAPLKKRTAALVRIGNVSEN